MKPGRSLISGDSPASHAENMIVVAIGASAGGLQPLQELFSMLPSDTNMCFVVVQHLSPDFDSVMDELLAKQTDMPIEIIETGKVLKPNTVYLNPPRADAQVIDGRFVLDVFPEDELRMPISSMFRSIAIEYGAESVAVVLSGTGSDGTAGLQRVHEFAGLTIVQSLETAQFDGMPKNAIATERVDYILSPGAIAQLLFEHSVEPVRRPSDQQTHNQRPKNPDDSTGIQLIFSLLANTYGINFAHYKPTTVARRIDRRLKLSCHDSLDEYSQVLLTDQDELDLLYHDLLIGVTKFFRDPKAFDLLSKEFDRLIDGLPDGEQLRIWSVGCASGEEAYSIAMMLWLLFEQRSQEPRFKVFATDVHDRILETASRGIYVADEIDGLSPELREQFLVDQGEGNVRVAPFLRNRLVFAKQNVVNDPPFTRVHMVVCRNLLIYLQDDAQASAISGFRFALLENGILMLGPSETLGKMAPGFDVIDKGWRLFRKNARVRDSMPHSRLAGRSSGLNKPNTQRLIEEETRSVRISDISRLLLADCLPSALLLDSKRKLLQVFGNVSDFMEYGEGNLGGSVFRYFRGETHASIVAVVDKAENELGTDFTTEFMEPSIGSELASFAVSAKSFVAAPGDPPVTLLRFYKRENCVMEADSEAESRLLVNRGVDIHRELSDTRQSLGVTIEGLETSNQELQAANEEMIAANEELQATNEELQSVNEELHSVNVEHQKKVQELEEVTDDFNNLFSSTEVGSILLDNDLCIRKFTHAAKRYFRLMEHDVGRPLSNFASQVSIDDFEKRIHEVMATGTEFSVIAKDRAGQLVSVEVLPYRASKRINGVIIHLTDLTAAILAANVCTGGIVMQPESALWQWDQEDEQMWWSQPFHRMFRDSVQEQRPSWSALQSLTHPDDVELIQPSILEFSSGERVRRIRMKQRNGDYDWFEFRWTFSHGPIGDLQTITGILNRCSSEQPDTESRPGLDGSPSSDKKTIHTRI